MFLLVAKNKIMFHVFFIVDSMIKISLIYFCGNMGAKKFQNEFGYEIKQTRNEKKIIAVFFFFFKS